MEVLNQFCLLVSGPPGAGKTTFARTLGSRLSVPLISMDEVKSGIALSMTARDADGVPSWQDGSVSALGGPAGQRAFEVTYQVAAALLAAGTSIVIEKAWQRGRAETELRPLLDLAHGAQLHVTSSQSVAISRGLARPSRPGLVNMAVIADMLASGQMRWDSFDPLDLPIPLLVLNTDAGAEPKWEEVERFVWQSTVPS